MKQITIDDLVEHYAKLASNPGFRHYVWHRVNEMAKESELWAELPAKLKEKMAKNEKST
jgi:hypothetical protein